MKLLLFWYFYTQQSVEFTQNGTKTFPVSGSSSGGSALLMKEIREEWPDWFELS